MALELQKYINGFDIWDILKKYVKDNIIFYNINPEFDDETLYNMLVENSQKTITNENDFKSFSKFLLEIKNHNFRKRSRTNFLRLCYALNISSIEKANSFLINYAHENELSPRSFEEFLMICGYKFNANYSDLYNIYIENKNRFDKKSPDKIISGETLKLYELIKLTNIESIEELKDVLNKPEFTNYFSKTRNSYYMALFDSVPWDIYSTSNNEEFFNESEKILNRFSTIIFPDENNSIVTNKKLSHTITELYEEYFAMISSNEDTPEDNPRLSREEITCLSDIYSNTFLTYATFRDTLQRKRAVDISGNVYLIKIISILSGDKTDYYYEWYTDFTNFTYTMTKINNDLIRTGFPALNEYDPFNKLFIDTYKEVISENPKAKSEELEILLFQRLRIYLREIIKLYDINKL